VQRVVEALVPRADLVRHLLIRACFQVLVTDMTHLPFAGGIAYLCVHLDWYGKLVLGWDLSLHPDALVYSLTSFHRAGSFLGWEAKQCCIKHWSRWPPKKP
jgi:hypothetical protein